MGHRWKGKGAKQQAAQEPLSNLYEQMKAWQDHLSCTLVVNGGIIKADAEQARIINAASFGSPLSIVPENELHIFHLSLEEIFYLNYELNCVDVYSHDYATTKLTHEELWQLMSSYKKGFMEHYKAFSHLRSKRWVVHPGPQYGADFVAYCHRPALVHSSYAVLVINREQPERMKAWSDVQSMIRLCGSVAKTLLLLYVQLSPNSDTTSFHCLNDATVEEVEARRWIPEKHR